MITFYLLGLIIFIVYIVVLISKFGIPKSISESSYLYGKNGNYIFWGGTTLFVLPLLIYWLDITHEQTYQFLVFLSCAALCFVAITGRFRGDEGKLEANLHTYGTIFCAVLAQTWMWLTFPKSWIISAVVFPIAIIAGLLINGHQRKIGKDTSGMTIYGDIKRTNSVVFWVEMALYTMAFVSIIWYRCTCQ